VGDVNDLSGKVALITGGSKGIGLGIVQRSIEQGASVLVVANDSQSLTSVSAQVAHPDRLDVLTADVSSSDDMQAWSGHTG